MTALNQRLTTFRATSLTEREKGTYFEERWAGPSRSTSRSDSLDALTLSLGGGAFAEGQT